MLLKNMSYELLHAVIKNDDYIPFLPQEVKEVDDKLGEHFLERYPSSYLMRVEYKVTEPEVVTGTEDMEKKTEIDREYFCDICGKTSKSKAGLNSHRRRHK